MNSLSADSVFPSPSQPYEIIHRRHPFFNPKRNLLINGRSYSDQTSNLSNSDLKKPSHLPSHSPSHSLSKSKTLPPSISIYHGINCKSEFKTRERADNQRHRLVPTPPSIPISYNCESFICSQKSTVTIHKASPFLLNKREDIKQDSYGTFKKRKACLSMSFVEKKQLVEHLIQSRKGNLNKGYLIDNVRAQNKEGLRCYPDTNIHHLQRPIKSNRFDGILPTPSGNHLSHGRRYFGRHIVQRRCYFGPAVVLNLTSKGILSTPHDYLVNFNSFISDQPIEWCNMNTMNCHLGSTTVKGVKRAREEGVFLFACDSSHVKRPNLLSTEFGVNRLEVTEPRITNITLQLLNTRTRKTKRAREEDVFVVPNDDAPFENKRHCFTTVRKDDLGTRFFKASTKAIQSIDNSSNCNSDKVPQEVALDRSDYYCSEGKHEHDQNGSNGNFFGHQETTKMKTDNEGLVEFEQSTKKLVRDSTCGNISANVEFVSNFSHEHNKNNGLNIKEIKLKAGIGITNDLENGEEGILEHFYDTTVAFEENLPTSNQDGRNRVTLADPSWPEIENERVDDAIIGFEYESQVKNYEAEEIPDGKEDSDEEYIGEECCDESDEEPLTGSYDTSDHSGAEDEAELSDDVKDSDDDYQEDEDYEDCENEFLDGSLDLSNPDLV